MAKINEEDVVCVKNKMGRIVRVSKAKADSMIKKDSAKLVEKVKTLEEMTKKELLIEGIKRDVKLDAKLTNKEIIELLSK